MKCLILAAGYATRLYPLTENFPKPLLRVGEKTILDWLIDDIDSSQKVDEYILVSNHKYFTHFIEWAEARKEKITVLDDGSVSNETRLGAVKDIQFAVEKMKVYDDMFVIAGDNVLDFSLIKFIEYALEKKTSCIMRYFEPDIARLRKSGIARVDSNEKVVSLVEKPAEPPSNWCCPPFYYYTAKDVSRINEAINDGCGTDAPGSLVSWLCSRSVIHAMEMPGSRYDVGTVEDYNRINSFYKGITE